jgi:hypothetical protein
MPPKRALIRWYTPDIVFQQVLDKRVFVRRLKVYFKCSCVFLRREYNDGRTALLASDRIESLQAELGMSFVLPTQLERDGCMISSLATATQKTPNRADCISRANQP